MKGEIIKRQSIELKMLQLFKRFAQLINDLILENGN